MTRELLSKLQEITEEEQAILDGRESIECTRYSQDIALDFTIDSSRLLEKGQLIEVRPHTRFVHFPKHKHNYVEMVYMCCGKTTHIINGTDKITLSAGDLLFLNQNATQEILPASKNDIAVNFIILPEFFSRSISMIEKENVLRDFLLASLCETSSTYSYLHFEAKEILPVQNLLENMIWTIFANRPDTNTINQTTMGLIFMNLSLFAENINQASPNQYEQNLVFTVLKYIETHYKDGTLAEICAQLKQPTYYVSRLLKKHMNKNFKELLQERKLQQAEYLLRQSSLSADQILFSIGYDNSSYFYRKFHEKYGCSPKEYRLGVKD